MKVNKLSMLNVDMLYKSVTELQKSDKFKEVKFGRNFIQLLNHVSFIFELEDVSRFDYLFLKMYTNDAVIINDNNQIVDNEYLENNFPEIYKSGLSPLISYNNKISEDTNNFYTRYFLPTGCITEKVVVTLSGSHAANIVTLEPSTFFILASSGKCKLNSDDDSSKELNENYNLYEDDDFINYVIKEFINGFYKFVIEKATYNDMSSDSFNYNNFFTLVNKSNVVMNSIKNPLFAADMINDDVKLSLDKFKIYKELNMDKRFTLQNTKIDFVIKSSFSSFIEMIGILPYEKFISIEALHIPSSLSLDPSNIPACPSELIDKYENRHKGRLTNIINDINNTYNNDRMIMKKLEMTQGYVEYRYDLSLKLSDIDDFILPYIDNENKIDDYISHEVTDIFNIIIKYSTSIFRALS